jgi:guanine deaminase
MKTHEAYLQEAIDYAIENVRLNGGKPFAALVVKEGEIVGLGKNEVLLTHDPTAHAELLAIRHASSTLQSEHLGDCILYASGHPCPMCLAAIYIAGIKTVYYGSSLEQASRHGFGVDQLYAEIGKTNELRRHPLQQLTVEEAENPFLVWKEAYNPSELLP